MSYHFKLKDQPVARALKRVARSQIDKAIAEIDNDGLPPAETIHQLRKRCKKLRGLIRLVRPAFSDYAKENRKLRDTARALAPAREAFVMVETLDRLIDRYDGELDKSAFIPIRDALQERASLVSQDDELAGKLADFREAMVKARGRVADWTIAEKDAAAVTGGLAKTYGRAVDALDAAEKDTGPRTMHEWRKRVKYHWYHTRLLREVWPAMTGTRRETADRLGDLLGDYHDLAVFRERLADLDAARAAPQAAAVLDGLSRERLEALAAEAFPLGHRLLAEKPGALAARYEEYWKQWRANV